MQQFFAGILRHVARAGYHCLFAFELVVAGGEHKFGKVNSAVAGGFGADQAAAVGEAFAGEHRAEFIAQALVLAEQIADFAAAHADVAGGHIGVGADVAVELAHKRLAKTHHFIVALAFGVEIGAAFAATHRQRGERIFKHLLERQKFQHAQIHAGVKTQAAFVGADGRIHLHAKAAVDLHFAGVVHPRHAKQNHTLGLHQALEQAVFGIMAVGGQKRGEAGKHFFYCLMKHGLVRVALFDLSE